MEEGWTEGGEIKGRGRGRGDACKIWESRLRKLTAGSLTRVELQTIPSQHFREMIDHGIQNIFKELVDIFHQLILLVCMMGLLNEFVMIYGIN